MEDSAADAAAAAAALDGATWRFSAQQQGSNNSAQGNAGANHKVDEEAAMAEKRKEFLNNKLNDPCKLRVFTATDQLIRPYWETVTMSDPREVFQSRVEPPGLTPELKRQFNAAVKLGSNTAKWHHDNKGVVCEYLLFMKDESLNLLKPQYAAMIRKCSRRTKCYILITNRILNRQVGKFKWIKYLIVQIQGPDYTMVKICNTMLERWFPEYRQRVVYDKQRYKFGIYTNESIVDNVDLYFPYQRTGKCATNFGDLPCETPYGATEARSALSTAWKHNNRSFAAGNLLPNNGPVSNVQSYVYAYHPLGPHDRLKFRETFGVQEPPLTFKMRSNMGYPPSNVCGPDYPGHPMFYDKGADGGEDDADEAAEEGAAGEEEVMDSSFFMLSDPEMKAKFKLKKMKLIMNRRREWIFGSKQLGVPYPQVLMPTNSITENCAVTRKDDVLGKGKRGKKKIKADILIRSIRFINEDNIYMEYCFEKEHLKRNPISPYPRSLVPGRELAERVNVSKVYIGPIKFDFVKDRRDELNQRFQMLGQAGSDISLGNQALSEKSASSQQVGRRSKTKTSLEKLSKSKAGTASSETRLSSIPVATFAEFKDKLTQDAIRAGNDPEDLLGKDRISAKNIDKVLPGWRSLIGRQDNIFEEVKTRLNVHRAIKDKYSNVKPFFNPQFDPYEDIAVTEPKSRVQPKVRRQMVKGIPISEKNPQKVATVLDELMEVFKKEELQPRST